MTDDWADLLVCLLDAGAHFLVVGAHAMAVHGVPLDSLRLSPEDLTTPDTVVQLGLPPARIDLLTGISGVPSFEEAWAGRVEHHVRDRSVPFLGRRQLIANKRAAGRKTDAADLEDLGE